MRLLTRWLVTFVTVLLVAFMLPFFEVRSLGAAAVFALVLSLINAFIRPFVTVLALPLTILTLGLFSVVVNLFLFWLAAAVVPGVHIGLGLLGLGIAALLVGIISGFISRLL